MKYWQQLERVHLWFSGVGGRGTLTRCLALTPDAVCLQGHWADCQLHL
jgi:hypothetical protein